TDLAIGRVVHGCGERGHGPWKIHHVHGLVALKSVPVPVVTLKAKAVRQLPGACERTKVQRSRELRPRRESIRRDLPFQPRNRTADELSQPPDPGPCREHEVPLVRRRVQPVPRPRHLFLELQADHRRPSEFVFAVPSGVWPSRTFARSAGWVAVPPRVLSASTSAGTSASVTPPRSTPSGSTATAMPDSQRSMQPEVHTRTVRASPAAPTARLSSSRRASLPFCAQEPLGLSSSLRLVHTQT